ncbi:MAG: hypothetical protein DI598_11120 [Pseudopedobacter saltans]|uniref:RNA polymerase sigma-70 factor n=1 Tax=Pseudopedobacter saltans TaxID=151895 RepID=A0A2W5F175_9SPHI|nr:MAG: hypothetical protein DI598_11120 [Pseudopedobacter saltans]
MELLNINNLKLAIASGNLDAFTQLFRQYYAKLVRFSIAITDQHEIAEEVASEVFVQLWNKRSQLASVSNLEAYMYQSIKNRSLNEIKSLKKNISIDKIEDPASTESSDSKIVTDEVSSSIRKVIQSLPSQCRTCYLLVKEEGMTYKQVGEILGISHRTVNAHLVIAIKQITEALKNN